MYNESVRNVRSALHCEKSMEYLDSGLHFKTDGGGSSKLAAGSTFVMECVSKRVIH